MSQAVAPLDLVRSASSVRLTLNARTVYLVLSWVFAVGLVVQVFAAGVGVFLGSFALHRMVPIVLAVILLGMLVTARPARLPRPMTRDTVVVLGLFIVQGLLADIRTIIPAISAFHPVNALLLVAVAFSLARRAWNATPLD